MTNLAQFVNYSNNLEAEILVFQFEPLLYDNLNFDRSFES